MNYLYNVLNLWCLTHPSEKWIWISGLFLANVKVSLLHVTVISSVCHSNCHRIWDLESRGTHRFRIDK